MDECKPLAAGGHGAVGGGPGQGVLGVVRQPAARAPPARAQGEAVQVDPIKPTLKAPGTKRLKLKRVDPLSSFGFKFNLHRYIKAENIGQLTSFSGTVTRTSEVRPELLLGRGAHSLTSKLNLRTFGTHRSRWSST